MILHGSSEERWVVAHGDALEVLRLLPDASVDAVVTDPPAGIEFMGKAWDSFTAREANASGPQTEAWHDGEGRNAYARAATPRFSGKLQRKAGDDRAAAKALQIRANFVAFIEAIFKEALRVLKPGGYALVWSIPKTSHWTTWAVENAGFEIVDTVAHLFGSGFPKSMDISKAIDKAAGAKREVVGPAPYTRGKSDHRYSETRDVSYNSDPQPITAPATDAARQWAGWGTALKPAREDWILARKPLDGTYAANVLKHGVGGLNIDACRVGGQRLELPVWGDEENLCGSCAEAAVRTPRRGTPATRASTATRNAGPTPSARARTHLEATSQAQDIECSNGPSPAVRSTGRTAASSLSIDESGNSHTVPSQPVTSFTTSTETSSTTGSRTCSSCGVPITGTSTTVTPSAQPSTAGAGVNGIPSTKSSTPSGNANAAAGSASGGRFPPNVALSHSPGCVRTGTRKVRSDGHYPSARPAGSDVAGASGHVGQSNLSEKYTDGETVEAWSCAEGCPIGLLDAQSGQLTSGTGAVKRATAAGNDESVAIGAESRPAGTPMVEYGDTGGASRFFYCAKAPNNQKWRVIRCSDRESCRHVGDAIRLTAGRKLYGRKFENLPPCPKCNGKQIAEAHPTPKNVELMRWLARLITPPGGAILDPFFGTGSTGEAALREGFRVIGIERDDGYARIAAARMQAVVAGEVDEPGQDDEEGEEAA